MLALFKDEEAEGNPERTERSLFSAEIFGGICRIIDSGSGTSRQCSQEHP